MDETTNLFCVYAEKDIYYVKEIANHFNMLRRRSNVNLKMDQAIDGGEQWDNIYRECLMEANIILVLFSANLLGNNDFHDEVLPELMNQRSSSEAWVIPVILSVCDWQKTELGRVQALPRDAKPIKTWEDQDQAFFDIKNNIERLVTVSRRRY